MRNYQSNEDWCLGVQLDTFTIRYPPSVIQHNTDGGYPAIFVQCLLASTMTLCVERLTCYLHDVTQT